MRALKHFQHNQGLCDRTGPPNLGQVYILCEAFFLSLHGFGPAGLVSIAQASPPIARTARVSPELTPDQSVLQISHARRFVSSQVSYSIESTWRQRIARTGPGGQICATYSSRDQRQQWRTPPRKADGSSWPTRAPRLRPDCWGRGLV